MVGIFTEKSVKRSQIAGFQEKCACQADFVRLFFVPFGIFVRKVKTIA